MRTAIKYSLTALLAFSALTAFSVQAQVPAPGPGAVAFPGSSAPAPMAAAPSGMIGNTIPSAVPSAAPSALPTPVSAAPAAVPASVSAGSSSASGNVPGNVQDVINKIKEPSQDVTLGDLNAAREAIAKLDVLIDIEKRLTDLAAIRKEREDKSMTAVAAALPPAAYSPPPSIGGAPADYGLPEMSKSAAIHVVKSVDKSGPEKIDVQKIIGTEGRYIAYIKSEGNDKAFKQGDKLSDGSVVSSISRSGVTLSKNKKTSTFQVKDIEKVFGAR